MMRGQTNRIGLFVPLGVRTAWLWMYSAWILFSAAFGQGRPDIVWMRSAHTTETISLAFSPDGSLLASVGDDVKLWRVSDGSLVRILPQSTNCRGVMFSPDGRLLVSAGNRIKLWRVSDGTLIRTIGNTYYYDAVFSPDGNLIAAGRAFEVELRWVSDGTLVRTLTYSDMEVPLSVAFSPDGLLVAAASIDPWPGIVLWHVSDGRLALAIPQGASFEVDFSPDGSLITGALESTIIKLLRVSDGALVRTLIGHTDYVLSVAFSPDGRLLVSSGLDNTIRLWSVSDGRLLRTYDQETTLVGDVQFSPNGQLFAYGRFDGMLVLARNPFARRQGDVNGDGCVDNSDLLAVLLAFANTGSNLPADLNGDRVVDDADLLLVLLNFGSGC
jgi:WD40 repeat protein